MPTAAPGRGCAPARARLWPLYAAGFTTAFGAHGVAANLGRFTAGHHDPLLVLGGLLALYDGAEVLLKPVFGALADRIGGRPVLLGGLAAFAASSLLFAVAAHTSLLWAARLGQGAAASAFSPAASALVARLRPAAAHGRAFGSYGFFKSAGHTAGPLLGGLLVAGGGLPLLFGAMTALAASVAVWAALAVPAVPPLPRARQTVADLAKRLAQGGFLRPTAALALATAALSAAVGFLPVAGAAARMGPVATGAAVSVLAVCAALLQPWAGTALDRGRITTGAGTGTGLALTAAGLALAAFPGPAGVLVAAVLVGAGTGLVTPLGFAALAASTPPGRLGATMGSAELGRELGDAGGPLVVAGVAAATTLAAGFAALAAVTAAGALAVRRSHARP
ncbi:MFS transporter [Streptacidiphilus sp. ASG 303]|uniref:MFS transporter n=1 Tax=Streptacidiphilus sp. ASG 303 TaxID=2896847 RepID=UPI001E35C110|nr:MFS transporter [Streptacidiphilus sp. ASG 303]MCD0484185.1 MFS transporter [Streptacidiphilus sp. ASG 303]